VDEKPDTEEWFMCGGGIIDGPIEVKGFVVLSRFWF
jgi:hypothetical protein